MEEPILHNEQPCADNYTCMKITNKCFDVGLQVEVKPNTVVGAIDYFCEGCPTVECEEDKWSKSCFVKITQKVCVKIPIKYGIEAIVGDETLFCDCKNKCDR